LPRAMRQGQFLRPPCNLNHLQYGCRPAAPCIVLPRDDDQVMVPISAADHSETAPSHVAGPIKALYSTVCCHRARQGTRAA
jgi:hypothetical protein